MLYNLEPIPYSSLSILEASIHSLKIGPDPNKFILILSLELSLNSSLSKFVSFKSLFCFL